MEDVKSGPMEPFMVLTRHNCRQSLNHTSYSSASVLPCFWVPSVLVMSQCCSKAPPTGKSPFQHHDSAT